MCGIPRSVVEVVESLRVPIKIKCSEKKCASKPKFTSTKEPFLTWKQHADVLHFIIVGDDDPFIPYKLKFAAHVFN